MMLVLAFIVLAACTSVSATDESVEGNFTDLKNVIINQEINIDTNINLQNGESYEEEITIDSDFIVDEKSSDINATCSDGTQVSIFTVKDDAKVIIRDLIIMNAYGNASDEDDDLQSGKLSLINCKFIANCSGASEGAIYVDGCSNAPNCSFKNSAIAQSIANDGTIYICGHNKLISDFNFTDGGSSAASAKDCCSCVAVGANNAGLANMSDFVALLAMDYNNSIAVGGALCTTTNGVRYIGYCNFAGCSVGSQDKAESLKSTDCLTVSNSCFASDYLKTLTSTELGLDGTFDTSMAADDQLTDNAVENHIAITNCSNGTAFESVTIGDDFAGCVGAMKGFGDADIACAVVGSRFINGASAEEVVCISANDGAIEAPTQLSKTATMENEGCFVNNSVSTEGEAEYMALEPNASNSYFECSLADADGIAYGSNLTIKESNFVNENTNTYSTSNDLNGNLGNSEFADIVAIAGMTDVTVSIFVPNINSTQPVVGKVTLKDKDGNGLNGTVNVTIKNNQTKEIVLSGEVNVVNGVANFNFNESLSVGIYIAGVDFKLPGGGSEGDQTIFDVSDGTDTYVAIIIPTLYVGDNIVGHVVLESFHKVKVTGVVYVSINEIKVHVQVTEGYGDFSIPNNLNEGSYVANVVYNGDGQYLSSKNNCTFKVTKTATKISIGSNINHYYGQNVSAVINLKGMYDHKNITGKVSVSINGTETIVDVVNGVGYVPIDPGLSIGSYEIIAFYPGNDRYSSSREVKTFQVTKIDTRITMEIPNHPVWVNVNATITLQGVNGVNLNGTVKGIINDEPYTTEAVDGVAYVPVDYYLLSGIYSLNTAVFAGDDLYKLKSTTTAFLVYKIGTPIDVTVNVNKNDITFVVKIPSEINDESVTLSINNQVYSVNVAEGYARLSIPMLPNGDYIVNVAYDGDVKFEKNETAVSFSVSGEHGGDDDKNHTATKKSTQSNVKKDMALIEKVEQTSLETGNPMVLLLLALFVLPVRRILKR